MKQIVKLIVIALFLCNTEQMRASQTALLDATDTLAFDLSQSAVTNVGGVYFLEFPVLIKSNSPTINAVDFWFKFDLNKMTYISTTSLLSSLDTYSNYNANNQFLSNSSSTTNISDYLPSNVSIMKLRFQLAGACTDVLATDFNTVTVLLNGNLSAYKFIGSGAYPAIQATTPSPLCSGTSVSFWYDTEINGHTIDTYAWDFGNGDSAQGQSSSSVYAFEGYYTITLVVTTIDGCSYTLTKDISVQPTPNVSFSSSYDGINNQMLFTDQSTIASGSNDSFEWLFGDNTSSTDQNPAHTYASSGAYNVTLTVTSAVGCTGTANQQIVVPVGVEEQSLLRLSVYPNPASELITFVSPSTGYLSIYDVTGRLLETGVFVVSNQPHSLSVLHLANGIYEARIIVGDGVASTKFQVNQ